MIEIVDFLPCGAENAISQRELAKALSCSRREIRALIFDARRRGAVICSTADPICGGYFLPRNDDEVKRFIMFAEHRISSTKAATKAAKSFLKRGGFNGKI